MGLTAQIPYNSHMTGNNNDKGAQRRRIRLERLYEKPWFQNAPKHIQQLYLSLEDPMLAKPVGRAFGLTLLVLIVVNAFILDAETSKMGPVLQGTLFTFNIVSTAAFAIEYFLRIRIANMVYPNLTPVKARFRYCFSLMGIIDMLSFVPSLIMFFLPLSPAISDAVRIIRLVRLIKISRYMAGLRTIKIVLIKRRSEIIAAFMLLALLTIASSVLMYEAEHAAQPDVFDSIFTGIYWAMTTITTTGYGDIVPITALGRIIGFATMVLAIATIAIPSGIFSAGFVEAFRAQREAGEEDTL